MNFALIEKGTSWADTHVSRSTSWAPTVNTFSAIALDSGPDSDGEDDVEHCQVNHVKKTRPTQGARRNENRSKKIKAIATNEAELESLIAALPKNWEGLEGAARNAPKDIKLAPGETWCMLDTGANVDAAGIESTSVISSPS